jgi:hypothetical protein
MMARMDDNLREIREEIKSDQEEKKSIIVACREETIACLGKTEARLE